MSYRHMLRSKSTMVTSGVRVEATSSEGAIWNQLYETVSSHRPATSLTGGAAGKVYELRENMEGAGRLRHRLPTFFPFKL